MKIKRSKDFKRWKIEHNKILLWIILVLITVLIFVVFQIRHLNNEKISDVNNLPNSTSENVGLANPASVYCINQSGKLDIRSDLDGNQYGVCIFKDGSECEEWKFFRGECKQGDSLI